MQYTRTVHLEKWFILVGSANYLLFTLYVVYVHFKNLNRCVTVFTFCIRMSDSSEDSDSNLEKYLILEL